MLVCVYMYYVYVLKSLRNGTVYYGYTSDLKRRLAQHNRGESTFTSKHVPLKLIYYEAFTSKIDAQKREAGLKDHGANKCHLKKRIVHSLKSVPLVASNGNTFLKDL